MALHGASSLSSECSVPGRFKGGNVDVGPPHTELLNSREIEVYRGKAHWATLLQLAPNLADRIVALEKQLRDNNDALTNLYERELARERRHILIKG